MSEPTPRLARHLALVSVLDLPPWSDGPHGPPDEGVEAIAAAGYRGVQVYLPDHVAAAEAAGLRVAGIGRADTAGQLATFVGRWEERGVSSLTIHLGTGFEDEQAAARLLEAYLEAAAAASIELLVETHRATVTQDPGRTVRFVEAYPELRFTGDLSHWYMGTEMPYGGFDWKLEAIAPVLRRVRMVHGRVADSSCAQVGLVESDTSLYVDHFRAMWRLVFEGFLDEPGSGELVFAPELLPPSLGYARTVPTGGGRDEEVDRWQQALLLCDLAEQLFADVRAAQGEGTSTGSTEGAPSQP